MSSATESAAPGRLPSCSHVVSKQPPRALPVPTARMKLLGNRGVALLQRLNREIDVRTLSNAFCCPYGLLAWLQGASARYSGQRIGCGKGCVPPNAVG